MAFNRTKSDCPCCGCHEREIGCHGQCERYGAWKKKEEERKADEKSQRQTRMFSISTAAIRRNWKEMKRHGVKGIGHW